MHADLYVQSVQLNGRSIGPDIQKGELIRVKGGEGSDPNPGHKKSDIPRRDNLNCIAVRVITDRTRPELRFCFSLPGI